MFRAEFHGEQHRQRGGKIAELEDVLFEEHADVRIVPTFSGGFCNDDFPDFVSI
jgi:hypothetical protein